MARFSPAGTLNAIREHAISLVVGVPSMFAAILRLKSASPEDFKAIYAIISGGEPLARKLARSVPRAIRRAASGSVRHDRNQPGHFP